MILVQANLGDMRQARYFDATADKPQAVFVSVVEQRRVKNDVTGQWEDGDKVWYDARFRGADADWVRDTLRNGDPLLLWGNTRRNTREVDGHTYTSTDLFVDAVSVNPRLRTVTIERAPRQDAHPGETRAVSQAVDTDPSPARPSEARTAAPAPRERYIPDQSDEAVRRAEQVAAESESDPLSVLRRRTEELVAANRVHPQFVELIRRDLQDTHGGPAQIRERVRHSVSGLPVAEREYLGSAVDVAAGRGRLLNWVECEQAQAWATVQEAKRDLAASAPQQELVGAGPAGPGL